MHSSEGVGRRTHQFWNGWWSNGRNGGGINNHDPILHLGGEKQKEDDEGMCVGAFSSKILAMMEAIGIRKGIEVAQAGGITHLIIESDSKLVVVMLHSPCTHGSLGYGIALEIAWLE
ncbi:uncharacterized protein G2W53_024228 [Senna tora]|uniref:RNase H type-1 domain-containing protein n=1 Tax=Senna tora TaxID=362788 RepID=A0A834TAW8_9FABA|nr:uncharacterized protein G2W53_024228 [Senna tora]